MKENLQEIDNTFDEESLSITKPSQKIPKQNHRKNANYQFNRANIYQAIILIVLSICIGLYFSSVSAFLNSYIQKSKTSQKQELYQDFQIKVLQRQKVDIYVPLQKPVQHVFNDLTNIDPQQKQYHDYFPRYFRLFERTTINIFDSKKRAKIEQELYNKDQVKQIDQYIKKNQKAIDRQNTEFSLTKLAKYNLKIRKDIVKQAEKDFSLQYKRLNRKFKLSSIKNEQPFCIIIQSSKKLKNYQIQEHLNSIFGQNYTNYHAVIIDIATQSSEFIKKYLKTYEISPQRAALTTLSDKVPKFKAISEAIYDYCQNDEIVALLELQDQLLGRLVLQTFNAVYQSKKVGVAYSNYVNYNEKDESLQLGSNDEYTPQQKADSSFRIAQKSGPFFTFRAQLLYRINPKHLQYPNGLYIDSAYHQALAFPLIELACGRVEFINQFNYFKTYRQEKDAEIREKVKYRKNYKCWIRYLKD